MELIPILKKNGPYWLPSRLEMQNFFSGGDNDLRVTPRRVVWHVKDGFGTEFCKRRYLYDWISTDTSNEVGSI